MPSTLSAYAQLGIDDSHEKGRKDLSSDENEKNCVGDKYEHECDNDHKVQTQT